MSIGFSVSVWRMNSLPSGTTQIYPSITKMKNYHLKTGVDEALQIAYINFTARISKYYVINSI